VTADRLDDEDTSSGRQPYEYVVVGGGIHSTWLANYLLVEGGCPTVEIRLVEPREQLLASFETKARQCEMRTLRSTHVQQADTEPFSLERDANGCSVLDDRTLAWQQTDGTDPGVSVVGALAEMIVGPFARSVVGSWRVAERFLATRNGTTPSRSRGET
jgi:hypothetical protein